MPFGSIRKVHLSGDLHGQSALLRRWALNKDLCWESTVTCTPGTGVLEAERTSSGMALTPELLVVSDDNQGDYRSI